MPPNQYRALILGLSALALILVGCRPAAAPPVRSTSTSMAVPTTTRTSTTTTTTTTTIVSTTTTLAAPSALVHPCPVPESTPGPLDGDSVTASQSLVSALICSATDVVVTAPDTAGHAALEAALFMGAPLVYARADQPYDPSPLGAARAWTTNAALVVAGPHAVLPIPAVASDLPGLVTSLVGGELPEDGRSEIMQEIVDETEPRDTLVMVSPNSAEMAASTASVAAAVEGAAIWAGPGDLRRRRNLAQLAEASTNRMLVGDYGADAPWQIDVLAGGLQLPGGGQTLFPGKRIVALYGHPHTGGLGVLGEQGPEAAVTRAHELAEPYVAEDTEVIPAFELITTLASSRPGDDGDYSSELTIDDLRPWTEAATAAGMYVVLDLQPGRSDFLTQAKRYEELLALPNVGLALDPEWRLGSDEFHLEGIGSVGGEEVNDVVRWLADMVRRHRLPQKLLVVHQFTFGMITDRELIETPAELAVVIQMDGQGPLGSKLATWGALVAGTEESGWSWGWKNFFDEDSPMATPERVLGLEPVPVFVSYQ